MSAPLNFYCHGYLATPIVEASLRRGLFERLDADSFRERPRLIKELGANAGYFTVALQVLESAGCIEKNGGDACRLTDEAKGRIHVFNLARLYTLDPQQLIDGADHCRLLAEKIDEVFHNGAGDFVAGLAQGAVILPLILALRKLDAEDFRGKLERLEAGLAGAVEKLFVRQCWFSAAKNRLTAAGEQMLRTNIFAAAAAYRPVLAAAEELLFGDHPHSTEGEGSRSGAEISANRLPVITDDLQLRSCLQDLRRETSDIFDSTLPEEQAQVVVDTGCGDGSLLIEALRQSGAVPVGRYIRSLVDHWLSVDEQPSANSTLAILAADQPDCYLDREGRLLDAVTVLGRWLQHLRDLAQDIRTPVLLVLADHAAPRFTGRYPDGSENFCFDSLYRFSRQYLISAEAFMILAASVGLFNQNTVRRYPQVSYFCRASLHRLIKRDYIVRHASESDLDRLDQLETLCWQHTRTSRQGILARLRKYPQGQFVLEKAGRVLGAIYSQRIADSAALEKYNAENVHELHNAAGSTIQLLAVNIDPAVQNLNFGDQLLEFMLQRCSLVTGVTRVAGVTLCKNYNADAAQPFEEYIQQQGVNQDPVLAFHQSHGASIVKALPGYRPQDNANLGNGVLVEYDILHRAPRVHETSTAGGETMVYSRDLIEQFLGAQVKLLLGDRKGAFALDRPLMEMGLDSADLLKLQQQIEEKFNRKFQPGFFFEYNSVNKVIAHLAPEAEIASGSGASAQTSASTGTGKNSQAAASSNIAIVGMSCKLPGDIETPEELWRVLASASSVIGSFPRGRGHWPSGSDKPGIDQGGFIENAAAFDAAFFRMSPTEAQVTDPQQRILLELAWTCFEDAAVLPESLKGTNTGVFVGASNCDYSRLVQAAGLEVQAHHATGSSLAVLANRLSYFFDLSGPSLAIDTACSASLVALHAAVQSLRSGECAAALVGGVNLICHPDLSVAYHKAGMLAPDGRCKVFDAAANGYVRSEGAVMLLLKPLARALAEQDRIHAVIKGSAVNHGGLAGGLTVPNPSKQSELLMAAWENAGISSVDLSYIEAHGTGTSLGDPVEIQGMQKAYAQLSPAPGPGTCAVGSVKSNLGHLEAAAGLAGLLKVILSLQYGELPASINFKQLNPKIVLEDTPFYIADRHQLWSVAQPRMAGVSSFGSGGANAHVVVAEWIREEKNPIREQSYLFIVSAKSRERLLAYAGSIVSWIDRHSERVAFSDFIYTFQAGRTAMEERLAIRTSGFSDLRNQLSAWMETGKTGATVWQGNAEQTLGKPDVFPQDDAGDELLAAKNLEQQALLWVSGCAIDFHALYKEVPNRISVPTYPFSGQSYWIDSAEKEIEHHLLGSQIPSAHQTVFAKTWQRVPGHFLLTQGDFSCLSLGFILEIFIAAGDRIFPLLEIDSINQFQYYPFHLDKGSPLAYEIRCFRQDGGLHAELVQLADGEQLLIAEAELNYSSGRSHGPLPHLMQTDTKWILLEEPGGNHRRLPVETLKSVFPALLGTEPSPAVSIDRILFHGSAVATPTMLVALNRTGVSVLTEHKQPLLSIINSSAG